MKITERGLAVLSQNPQRIDQNFLKQFPEFLDFKDFRTDNHSPLKEESGTAESTLTPQEIVKNSYQDVRNKLAHEPLSQS